MAQEGSGKPPGGGKSPPKKPGSLRTQEPPEFRTLFFETSSGLNGSAVIVCWQQETYARLKAWKSSYVPVLVKGQVGVIDWSPLTQTPRNIVVLADTLEFIPEAQYAVETLAEFAQVCKLIPPPVVYDKSMDGFASWSEFARWATSVAILEKAESPKKATVEAESAIQVGEEEIPAYALEAIPDEVLAADNGEAPLMGDLWVKLGLSCGKSGPHANADNAFRVLTAHVKYKGHLWYDEFSRRVMTNYAGKIKEWEDMDSLAVMMFLQGVVGIQKMSSAMVYEAVRLVAAQDRRNHCRDWLDALQWDAVNRLDALIPTVWGSADNPYTQGVGRCWMVSMVARVFRPGCKVDTVPVFEGAQGIGKSRALQVLGAEFYTQSHETILNKDFYQIMDGYMLVELSEMHSFNRSDVERIKGIISNPVDRYRAPYDRSAKDNPRQSVLAGTTNKDDWNTDDTGARRFWPIACGSKVDLKWLQNHRDLLFAEAVSRFKNGEKWWDVPELEAKAEQEKRRIQDPWIEEIERFLIGKSEVTAAEIMADCLKLERTHRHTGTARRISAQMKELGWRQTFGRERGKRTRLYVPKQDRTDGLD